ncbi:unnamed protein product [Closterium sp. Yama58-4]|nr:unnamed protein product [Closterium sp. Yama58-4]
MHRSGTFPVSTLDGDGDVSPSHDFPRNFPRSHSSAVPAALRTAYDSIDSDDPFRHAATPPASLPRHRHHSPRHAHPHQQQQHGAIAPRHVSYQAGLTSSLRPHSHGLRDDGGGGAARFAQDAQHQRSLAAGLSLSPHSLSPHGLSPHDGGLGGGPLGDFFDEGAEDARGGLRGHAQLAGRDVGHLHAGSLALDAERGGFGALGEGGGRHEGRGRVWARTLSHQAADLSSSSSSSSGAVRGRHLVGAQWLGLDRSSSGFDDTDILATNAVLPRVNSLTVNGSGLFDSDDLLDLRHPPTGLGGGATGLGGGAMGLGRDGAGLGGARDRGADMDSALGIGGALGLARPYGRENGGAGAGGEGINLKRVLRLGEAARSNDADLVHAILQDAPSRHPLLSALHPATGRTVLHEAVVAGSVDAAAVLLEWGADPNGGTATQQEGFSPPLLWAVQAGNEELVRLLLTNGADINATDAHRCSALHYACSTGHRGIIKLLLVAGANMYARNSDGLVAQQLTSSERIRALFRKLHEYHLRSTGGGAHTDHTGSNSGGSGGLFSAAWESARRVDTTDSPAASPALSPSLLPSSRSAASPTHHGAEPDGAAGRLASAGGVGGAGGLRGAGGGGGMGAAGRRVGGSLGGRALDGAADRAVAAGAAGAAVGRRHGGSDVEGGAVRLRRVRVPGSSSVGGMMSDGGGAGESRLGRAAGRGAGGVARGGGGGRGGAEGRGRGAEGGGRRGGMVRTQSLSAQAMSAGDAVERGGMGGEGAVRGDSGMKSPSGSSRQGVQQQQRGVVSPREEERHGGEKPASDGGGEGWSEAGGHAAQPGGHAAQPGGSESDRGEHGRAGRRDAAKGVGRRVVGRGTSQEERQGGKPAPPPTRLGAADPLTAAASAAGGAGGAGGRGGQGSGGVRRVGSSDAVGEASASASASGGPRSPLPAPSSPLTSPSATSPPSSHPHLRRQALEGRGRPGSGSGGEGGQQQQQGKVGQSEGHGRQKQGGEGGDWPCSDTEVSLRVRQQRRPGLRPSASPPPDSSASRSSRGGAGAAGAEEGAAGAGGGGGGQRVGGGREVVTDDESMHAARGPRPVPPSLRRLGSEGKEGRAGEAEKKGAVRPPLSPNPVEKHEGGDAQPGHMEGSGDEASGASSGEGAAASPAAPQNMVPSASPKVAAPYSRITPSSSTPSPSTSTAASAPHAGEAACGAASLKWKKGEMLGEGAYGKVFLGLNEMTGELMAVKEIKMTTQGDEKAMLIAALEREIVLYKKMRHRHIVGYIDMEKHEADGSIYIFLEFVSGGSIHSMLEKFGAFSESLVRVYTRQLLLGLEYLHACRIVHRDIKGGNVLVDRDGVIKLADFGASKSFHEGTVGEGCKSMRGSVFWMAPEVIKGEGYGRRADIWSVGCTVIEMLTGRHPWPGMDNTWSAIFHIAKTTTGPPIPEGVSTEATDFLTACFQLDPNQRPSASHVSPAAM